MSDNNTYSDIMAQLEDHYEKNKVEVFIPSLNKAIPFSPISVKQHKSILKTEEDLLSSGLQFNININKIILDNCEFDELLLTDRPAILLALKNSQLDGNLLVNQEGTNHEINLQDHIQTFGNNLFDKELVSKTLTLDTFSVHCKIPTISHDILINEKIKNVVASERNNSLTDKVGNLFIYEIIKYIDVIESHFKLEFKKLTFQQQISICEMIPMSLIEKIISYINTIRETELSYIKCKNTKGEYIQLPLSVTLFAGD